jgi:hypothetical protein
MPQRVLAVGLAVLLGANVAGWVVNQATLPRDPRLERSSRELREVAQQSRNVEVRYVFAPMYLLRDRIRGATLVLPRRHEHYRFLFEHVAQLRLELVDDALAIDAAAVPGGEPFDIKLRRREVRHARLIVDPAARRYVLADAGDGGLVVLPEPVYLSAR